MIHGDRGFNSKLYPRVLATIKQREGSNVPELFPLLILQTEGGGCAAGKWARALHFNLTHF